MVMRRKTRVEIPKDRSVRYAENNESDPIDEAIFLARMRLIDWKPPFAIVRFVIYDVGPVEKSKK